MLRKTVSKLKAEKEIKAQKLKSLTTGALIVQSNEIHDENNFAAFPIKLNDLRFTIEDISSTISEDDLKEYFDEFGEVIDVFIEQAQEEKLRTAHITFSHFTNDWPQKQHVIQDILVTIENVRGDIKKPSDTIVVIGDIQEISGQSISNYLTNFGCIVDFRRSVNWKTNKLSRFVFIKFQNAADAEAVLNTKKHVIEGVDVDIFPVP